MEEEEELSKEDKELIFEVLFKKIMEIMKKPEVDLDPFKEMLNRLSVLSGIFSFKGMISLVPELVAYAIRYGMMTEKAYEEEQLNLDEDTQGLDPGQEQEKRITRIKKDIDKLSMYL